MNKKGLDFSVNFIVGLVLVLIVVAVIALWLFFGSEGGLKGKLTDFVTENIVKKLGGG